VEKCRNSTNALVSKASVKPLEEYGTHQFKRQLDIFLKWSKKADTNWR